LSTETEIVPVRIQPETLYQIQLDRKEEKQVVVHCFFQCDSSSDQLIRIWKTTYLKDNKTGHRSHLLFFDQISLYPFWTRVDAGSFYTFTLIFSGLPADCQSFDLIEDIPDSGGFFVPSISRNTTDVYRVRIQ
jgi:hypothetical protein